MDRAKPDIAPARKFRLRYVHVPHGYDGIRTNLQLRLARAAQEFSGPIYVHCHPGKHPHATSCIGIPRETARSREQAGQRRPRG